MTTAKRTSPAFQVGDRVRFVLNNRKVWGVIIEDRGNIGVGGRRLFYVEVPLDPDEPMVFLMPADELERDPDAGREPPDKASVVKYLKQGGLVGILLTITPGSKNQPR